MESAEQWQLDAAIAALSSDGRSLARSLRGKLEKVQGLRFRFEAREPAPRGELIISYDETEIARVQMKPGKLPKLAMGDDARELTGLTQAAKEAERIAARAKEIAAAAPQLGLFGP